MVLRPQAARGETAQAPHQAAAERSDQENGEGKFDAITQQVGRRRKASSHGRVRGTDEASGRSCTGRRMNGGPRTFKPMAPHAIGNAATCSWPMPKGSTWDAG